MAFRLTPGLGVALLLLSCGGGSGFADREILATLAEGNYRCTSAHGHLATEEARLLAVTARLDRAAGTLVLTLADGSRRTLQFSPRPRDRWKIDCQTMNSHIREETADISPQPLLMESLSFPTPVAYAKCAATRMILSNGADDLSQYLVLDLQ